MLGPLEVRTASGSPVELGGARLRALLVLLALEPGRVVTASRLIDALWPHQAPAGAANALQALVSRLRRAVPEIEVVARPSGYQLVVDPSSVDVFEFERLAATGRDQSQVDPVIGAATLRKALALWRGPALADVADQDFARESVVRLNELRLTALEDRIDADLRMGAYTALVAELEGLVAAYPMRESMVGRLMRALRAAGRPGAALATFERTRALLADQLGAEPSAELSAMHLAILRDDGSRPPKRAAGPVEVAAARTNLRAELTSFVGRDEELVQVGEVLAEQRLTTLIGPGGAGKTRFAVVVARGQLPDTPDGVWLVELAPVTDPREVPRTVLEALGLSGLPAIRPLGLSETPRDPLDRLVMALSGKRPLIVLDNCEHLLAAAAHTAHRLLGECPGVRIVATSREPLNIPGETLWPVEPLALPPLDLGQDQDKLLSYAAVRLFVDRARAVRSRFTLDEGNADAVARICRALDGMPLAIELAAARLRAMDPEQVAERLDDRFRLLTGGSRTALPRHQTLRAVVDWSWDLLDEEERALWRRFSVFAGGATLDAIEQICLDGESALDLLAAQVDKSLLTVRHGPDGPRYRMLETIKAYGQQRLAEAGEREAIRRAHGAYFLKLADLARLELLHHDQLTWLARLRADHDNLHVAIIAAIAAGDAATAVSVAGALGWYWWLFTNKQDGIRLITTVIAMPGEVSAERRALACAVGALLAVASNDEATAMEMFHKARLIVSTLDGVEDPLLRLVGPLSAIIETVETGTAAGLSVDSFDEVVADPEPWIRASALMIRGHIRLNFGREHDLAMRDFELALGLYESVGERWGQAFTLASIATLQSWAGDFAAAAVRRQRALDLASELGISEDGAQFRIHLARELWLMGDRQQALVEMHEALRSAERLGLPDPAALAHMGLGELARVSGDLATARLHLERAGEMSAELSIGPQFRALVLSAVGYLHADEGDLRGARARHEEAVRVARSSMDAPVIAQVLVGLADVCLREGDAAKAAEWLGSSIAIRGTIDRTLVDQDRVEAGSREALGDDAFEVAYQRGKAAAMESVATVAG
jgi:predicted ATPase/DNA-binding SARP family transcriptional activator/tetratricopeptide (TPR) repeat protein